METLERFKIKDFQTIFVREESSIFDVIKRIDESGHQMAIVVNEEQVLLGTVSDGDIRRGLLKGISLQGRVGDIMNRHPFFLSTESIDENSLRYCFKNLIRKIPIIDEKRVVKDVLSLDKQSMEVRERSHATSFIQRPPVKEQLHKFFHLREAQVPVVIMAGGLGTRLAPMTEHTPKPMLQVGEKPILETIIGEFHKYGYRRFFISVNYHSDLIEEYFGHGEKWGVEISYIKENLQAGKRLGTAGSLKLLPAFDTPILVTNGDILTRANYTHLLDLHLESNRKATVCVRKYGQQIPYGVTMIDENSNTIMRIDEKPTYEWFVNAGIYVLEPELLQFIPADSYFDMTSLFQVMFENNIPINAFPLHEYWIDIGNHPEYNRAQIEFHQNFRVRNHE